MRLTRKQKVLSSIGIVSITLFGIFQNFTTFLHGDGNGEMRLPPFPVINQELRSILNMESRSSDLSKMPKFSRSYIPSLRFTADGRIGLNSLTTAANELQISLMNPEKFLASAGSDISTKSLSLPLNRSVKPTTDQISKLVGHVILCDPTTFANNNVNVPAVPTGPKNPYKCKGAGVFDSAGTKDCYDLKILGVYNSIEKNYNGSTPFNAGGRGGEYKTFYSQEVRVVVTNPKTSNAAIESISFNGNPKKAKRSMQINALLEPVIAGDGRLLVVRLSDVSLKWNANDPTAQNIVYSSYVGGDACDIDKFGDFKPITYAHYDGNMKDRYKFAAYPLRDPQGTIISPGSNLPATYQWIDSNASNLMFAFLDESTKSEFLDSTSDLGRYRCKEVRDGSECNLDGGNGEAVLAGDGLRGLSIAGLWTHGKIVLLDGFLNNSDFSFPYDKERALQIYSPKGNGVESVVPNDGTSALSDFSGWLKFSIGRASDAEIETATEKTAGGGGLSIPSQFVRNTTFIDSLENRLNGILGMGPATPRDVVWKISTGLATDEVTFDEYLNPNVLINVDMTGLISVKSDGTKKYWDTLEVGSPIKVQNSATSDFKDSSGDAYRNIPKYGQLTGSGNNEAIIAADIARLESVAMGGIHGKGLWLNGNTGLKFDMPVNANTAAKPLGNFYFGLFIDFRNTNLLKDIRVATFPDNSHIDLALSNSLKKKIRFTDSISNISQDLIFSEFKSTAWNHLGFVLKNGSIDIYQNGNYIGTVTTSVYKSKSAVGSLKIGGGKDIIGIKGWIDEVKLIANYQDNPELACNYARGSIVFSTKTTGVPTEWINKSSGQVKKFLSNINSADSTKSNGLYVCSSSLYGISPTGTSFRQKLIFPESIPLYKGNVYKGLVFGQSRPDSRTNNFCLSCHVDNNQASSLQKAVLNTSKEMQMAPRQPSQPPRYYSGVGASASRNGDFVDQYFCNNSMAKSKKCSQLRVTP